MIARGQGTIAFRANALAVFFAVAFALPLAACTSSGVSSFSNATNTRLAAGQTGGVAVSQDAALAQGQTANDEIALASLAAEEDAALGAIAPVDERLRPRNDRIASLQTALPLNYTELSYAGPAEERAAEKRIGAVYGRIAHGECKGGWGPKPSMINAKRIDPANPYYMEMRLRQTPPLPIGHVYVAYGRIGADGEPVDEKLVMLSPIGGYAGAAVAGAIPMPGVLTPHPDDCVYAPIAAYRVSLGASQYEQLLLEIERQKKKKPLYSLFAYNCNGFLSDVVKSVGILPPENIYNPSLVYFYDMMDRNEGRKVPRTAEGVAEYAALNIPKAN